MFVPYYLEVALMLPSPQCASQRTWSSMQAVLATMPCSGMCYAGRRWCTRSFRARPPRPASRAQTRISTALSLATPPAGRTSLRGLLYITTQLRLHGLPGTMVLSAPLHTRQCVRSQWPGTPAPPAHLLPGLLRQHTRYVSGVPCCCPVPAACKERTSSHLVQTCPWRLSATFNGRWPAVNASWPLSTSQQVVRAP
jgi:hypothetical protein